MHTHLHPGTLEQQQHPLRQYPEEERIDYLSVLAALIVADGKVADAEITQLREFCQTVDIDEFGIGMLIAVVENPAIVDFQTIFARLAETDLRFTLLTDLFFIAYADGIVSPHERTEITQIAAQLNISSIQFDAITQYVETIISTQTTQRSEADWTQAGSELAGVLAGAGVPLGAVAIAGTIVGKGISSGLSALGMGLGLPTGIGVAISLGLCSYFGVRWLCKKLTTKS